MIVTSHKRKPGSQLQKKPLDMVEQRTLNMSFFGLISCRDEIKYIGIFQDIMARDRTGAREVNSENWL